MDYLNKKAAVLCKLNWLNGYSRHRRLGFVVGLKKLHESGASILRVWEWVTPALNYKITAF